MSASPREPLDYERVRSQLAERGYLGGRVGRFVLQEGTGHRRSPRLVRTAAKAAVLGAPVLALLVAATVARDNRPLIAPRDFPLLWLYFTPLCAAALFVLDAAVGWVSGRLTGIFGIRGGEITRAALLAGVPTAFYLFLLGVRAERGQGLAMESAFFALGVLVVVFVSWLAGLVSVAGILGRTGEVAGRRARSLRTLFIVIPIAMLAGTVVRLSTDATGAEAAPVVFDTVPAERFLFLGVDGLDGEWVESLEPTGAVGRLLDLMASGAMVPLAGDHRGEPPEVWTSMMTGVAGSVHGLRSAGAEVFPGVATPLSSQSGRLVSALRLAFPSRTVPASASARRVHTVWEIVAQRRRALSVGWWGSWPAEGGSESAWVVSDRVLPKLLSEAEFDRDAWPDALHGRLRDAFEADRENLREEYEAIFVGLEEAVGKLVWESFLIDAFHSRTLTELWDSAAVESAFVYLPGLEILRHRASTAGLPILQQAAVFEAYTGWLDRELGSMLSAVGEETAVLLVGDPGRGAGPTAEPFAVVRSRGVTAPCVDPPLDALTVTPLALALNGFPLSDELPAVEGARCLAEITSTVGTIPTYGRKRVRAREAVSAYDDEMVERLRSLGYLN